MSSAQPTPAARAAAAGPASLEAVAAHMLSRVDPLAVEVLEAISAELPELAVDAELRSLLSSTVLDNMVAALRILSGASGETSPAAPPAALEFARRLAQRGIDLTALLRAYRLGQAAFQQTAIRQIGTVPHISAADIREASLELSSFAFGFIDSVSEQVVAAYQSERDRWLRQRDATQFSRVRGVLDGSTSDLHEAESAVGLRLDGTTVAAVLWQTGHAAQGDPTAVDEQAAALASALGCSRGRFAAVTADASTVWAWFSGCDDTAPARDFVPTGGTHVALGEPGRGLDGFRVSHQQSLRVQHLARQAATEPAVLTAAEVGPLLLLDVGADEIRAWVAATLGALAAADDAAARLRDTAWSYLSSGNSLNAAAAELHLHKNTIQYRLRRAEEVRGRPLHERRLELEVALLACRVLGDSVLTAPDD